MGLVSVPSEARRRNMAAIRSQDTKIELLVRSSLHAAGFRFSLHRRDLPGRPDIVLPAKRAVVLVHGCFWHGHICKEAKRPKSNRGYWTPKIEGNMRRDRRVRRQLRAQGWSVFVVRECTVHKDTKRVVGALRNRH